MFIPLVCWGSVFGGYALSKRELASLLKLLLLLPWVGLQCMNVVFSDHTHLFFWHCMTADLMIVNFFFRCLDTSQTYQNKKKTCKKTA